MERFRLASHAGRRVARFSLQGVNTVAVLDLTTQDSALKGIAEASTDGAYGYNFYAALRRGKLSHSFSMVFRCLHSQTQRMHILIRFEKGETLVFV